MIPCYSGDDHGAKQIDNWVLTARRKNRSGDRVVSCPSIGVPGPAAPTSNASEG